MPNRARCRRTRHCWRFTFCRMEPAWRVSPVELRSYIPWGFRSEQLAVESIVRTLEANVPQVLRLKILIHGQEVDTLAGHMDLTQTFQVKTTGASAAQKQASPASIITAPIEKAVEKVKDAVR